MSKKVYFDYGYGWEDVSQFIRDDLVITPRFATNSYKYAQNVANMNMLIGTEPEIPDGSTAYYYMDDWTEATASGWILTLGETGLPDTRGGVYQRDFITISGGMDYVLKLKCTATGSSSIALVGEKSDDTFEIISTAYLSAGESVTTFVFTAPDTYTGLGFVWDARVNVEWNWIYVGDGLWVSNLDKLRNAAEVKVKIIEIDAVQEVAHQVYEESDWTEATASGWTLTLAPDGYPDEFGGIYKKDFLTDSFQMAQVNLTNTSTKYIPVYLCGQITGDTFDMLGSTVVPPGDSSAIFDLVNTATVSGLGLIWPSDVNIEISQIYLGNKVSTQLFQGVIAEKPSYDYDGIFENIQIAIEATDRIRKLDVEMGDFVMRNAKIMDYTDKDNSIIHQLAYEAGFSDDYIAEMQILVTLSGFSPASEKSVILTEMDKLLYENGYVLHMDEYDRIHPLPWIVASGTYSYEFNESNIVSKISVKESERDYEGCKVVYNELGEKHNVLLYRDDLPINGDGTFTGFFIPSGYFYPLEANVIDDGTGTYQEVFQEYDDSSIKALTNKAIVNNLDFDTRTAMSAFKSDYSAIVATSGHYLEYRIDGGLTPDIETYYNKKSQVRFNNNTASGLNIYYMNVKGSCLYRTADRFSEVITISGTKKIEEYISAYVFDKTTADTLAQYRAMDQDYGRFEYKFKSEDSVDVGTVVRIYTEARMDQLAIVLEKVYEVSDEMYSYTCKGYSQNVSNVSRIAVYKAPATNNFDVVSIGLSSYNLNIISDINGENLVLDDASITAKVLINGMDDTTNWTYSVVATSGVLGSLVSNTYTVSGMADDVGYVDIGFSKTNYTSQTLRCNVNRNRQGTQEYVITTIPQYSPVYKGPFLDTEPVFGQNGDTYLRYSTSSGITNRGVFVYDKNESPVWVRTEAPDHIYKALTDIVYLCQLRNSDGTSTLYGTEQDYGVTSTIQSAHIMAAIIDRLRVGDLDLYGTLRSSLMDTINTVSGETITAPTKTYWEGSDFVTVYSGMAEAWVAASGLIDGNNITHVLKGGSTDAVSYQSVDSPSFLVGIAATITSAVSGPVRIYITGRKPYSYSTSRIRIFVNGLNVGEVYTELTTTNSTHYFSVDVNVGDTIELYTYNVYTSNFRVCPDLNTVGIWNDTNSTALSVAIDRYYNQVVTVYVSGYSDFSSASNLSHWKGSELRSLFIGKIPFYRTIDVAGGTFNSKTCSQIYCSDMFVNLSYESGSDDSIDVDEYYTYTGSIILPDVEGKILFGDENAEGQYELWSHNIPGGDNNILTIRNTKTGKVFSIWEVRSPDTTVSGYAESTFSLHNVVGSDDFVHDDSMHNYSGNEMHYIDGFYNYGGDWVGDWKRVAKRTVSAWEASTVYEAGDIRYNGSNVYLCVLDGTSAGSGGPTGTTKYIVDNTTQWQYIGAVSDSVWEFLISQHASLTGKHWFAGGRKPTGSLHGTYTQAQVFEALANTIPLVNDEVILHGGAGATIFSKAKRITEYSIYLYYVSSGGVGTTNCLAYDSGSVGAISISW